MSIVTEKNRLRKKGEIREVVVVVVFAVAVVVDETGSRSFVDILWDTLKLKRTDRKKFE